MVMEDKATHEAVAYRFLQLAQPAKILGPYRCAGLHLDPDDSPATIFDDNIDLVLILGSVVRE